MAVLLLALCIAAACDDAPERQPNPTVSAAAPTARPTPAAPPTPIADLGPRIGVRGGLPQNDPLALAERFAETSGRAPAAKPFTGEANVGDRREFLVLRLSGRALSHEAPPETVTIAATLLAKSEHAYFYIDDALEGDADDVEEAAQEFEASTWPVVTGAFGEPAIPGVDGDPRIIVLQADLGGAVGGYYSGDDAYVRAVRELSNEAEMVYLDRILKPGGAAFNVVLAHEFQHLIHAKNDPGEESWVNEGLSEDASMLVGGAVSSIKSFEGRPETQLNFWDTAGGAPHYGAGAAFFRYLTSRFGGDTQFGALARAAGDGSAGVDEFLASAGEGVRFRDVFADWIAANVLNLESGPYGNPERELDVRIVTELEDGDAVEGEAQQFGTDYYGVSGLGDGAYVLQFEGEARVGVLPSTALERGPVLWSNREDDIDTRMTMSLDLRGTRTPELTFATWYDIEPWYDWGYVAVSTDGGAHWEALPGEQTSTDDAVKLAYGPGYTGVSGGGEAAAWVDERIDLSRFAGREVLVRFEYVTDGGTHAEGWAVRDVAAEDAGGTGASGASAIAMGAAEYEGWLEVGTPLAQSFAVRLIITRDSGATEVLDVPLDAAQSGELRFDASGIEDAVLAIAGTTEGTNQVVPYTVELVRG